MPDPRVLVKPGVLREGARVELDPIEARHVITVLRQRPGDVLEALDGAGRTAVARLGDIRRDRVVIDVTEVSEHPPPRGPAIDLALAVLHTSAMDWAVQKAVELGVRRLLPVVAARSQAGARAVARRSDHWRRAADQALKQCRRPWALDIRVERTVDELVSDPPAGPMVASVDGVRALDADIPPSGATLVVGPEGGFDDRELATIREARWPMIRLGAHTLRAETAAVAGVAVLQQLLAVERPV